MEQKDIVPHYKKHRQQKLGHFFQYSLQGLELDLQGLQRQVELKR
jgi:hypothetical protein